jgi:hypothetical protein
MIFERWRAKMPKIDYGALRWMIASIEERCAL